MPNAPAAHVSLTFVVCPDSPDDLATLRRKASTCVTEETLELYHLGQCAKLEAFLVKQHLSSCNRCRERLRDVAEELEMMREVLREFEQIPPSLGLARVK